MKGFGAFDTNQLQVLKSTVFKNLNVYIPSFQAGLAALL